MSEPVLEDANRVPKAAELIAAQIRRQIVTGEFAEGQMLPPERELLAQLKVSRPTLRQAFRILETERLITVQRGARGGTTVHTPSRELASRYLGVLLQFRGATLADLHAARLMIEPAAAADLARRHDDEALTELRSLIDLERAADQAGGEAGSLVADQFHVRLVELAGNQTLAAFAGLLQDLSRAHLQRAESTRRQARGARSPSTGGIGEHQRLIELIEAGAAHEAARHWREHLEAVRDTLAERFGLMSVLDLEI